MKFKNTRAVLLCPDCLCRKTVVYTKVERMDDFLLTLSFLSLDEEGNDNGRKILFDTEVLEKEEAELEKWVCCKHVEKKHVPVLVLILLANSAIT